MTNCVVFSPRISFISTKFFPLNFDGWLLVLSRKSKFSGTPLSLYSALSYLYILSIYTIISFCLYYNMVILKIISNLLLIFWWHVNFLRFNYWFFYLRVAAYFLGCLPVFITAFFVIFFCSLISNLISNLILPAVSTVFWITHFNKVLKVLVANLLVATRRFCPYLLLKSLLRCFSMFPCNLFFAKNKIPYIWHKFSLSVQLNISLYPHPHP